MTDRKSNQNQNREDRKRYRRDIRSTIDDATLRGLPQELYSLTVDFLVDPCEEVTDDALKCPVLTEKEAKCKSYCFDVILDWLPQLLDEAAATTWDNQKVSSIQLHISSRKC